MKQSLESRALEYAQQLLSWNQDILAPHVDKDMLDYDILKQVQETPQEVKKEDVKKIEAVIRTFGRPVLFIINGTFQEPKSSEWQSRLAPRRESINRLIPAVGRIEVRFQDFGASLRSTEYHVGTGFMVGPNVLLTNRHVAEAFCYIDGSIRDGFNPLIDFIEEHEHDPDREYRIIRALKMGSSFDFALLEVQSINGHRLPEPLEYTREKPEELLDGLKGTLIFTIGYPAFDPDLPARLQAEIFEGIFGVKRLAPGRLRKIQSDLFANLDSAAIDLISDYTSLGGNSGSAVFDLDTGKVIGLHYAGAYLKGNFSVPIWRLSHHIDAAIQTVRTSKTFVTPKPSELVTEEDEGLTVDGIKFIQESLHNEPDATLEYFRGAWDSELSPGDLVSALERLRLTAENSRDKIARESAIELAFRPETEALWPPQHWGMGKVELPPGFSFPDMTDEITIDAASSKFEDERDAAGWVRHAAGKFLAEKLGLLKKEDFRWAEEYSSRFVYPMAKPAASDGKICIGLFSDFGTGLYHSLYIARHMTNYTPTLDYVFHLGDVYYTGTEEEFQNYFINPLEQLTRKTRLFTLNANHEMLSGGFPYFKYIDDRRNGSSLHEQEGSYFCIRSEQFQIIGIDTDYHERGRHSERKLNRWLAAQLEHKRIHGTTNILLSANEPYSYKTGQNTDLLTEDLNTFVREGLIDLWFWGNEHYCALYKRADDAPFIGSCVGHGGFPYDRIGLEDLKGNLQKRQEFLEDQPRFPESTGVRPDRGNNGFAILVLDTKDNTITLKYIDWMRETRFTTRIGKKPHGLDFLA